MHFLPMCIYWDRDIVTCFKVVLKDPNVNPIMEHIKLQYLCSVEPNDVSGTSKIKTKIGKLLHQEMLTQQMLSQQMLTLISQ